MLVQIFNMVLASQDYIYIAATVFYTSAILLIFASLLQIFLQQKF